MIRHYLVMDNDLATIQAFDRLTGRLEEKPPAELPWVDPNTIETAEPFCSLFQIKESILEEIKEFDPPGTVTTDTVRSTYGRVATYSLKAITRVIAAKYEGVLVTVAYREFADEDEAVLYALAAQLRRRNLTDAEIVRSVLLLEHRSGAKRPTKGRPAKNGKNLPFSVPTAKETAKTLGTTEVKVKKLRAIIDHASHDVKEAVENGEVSIDAAHKKVQADRKPYSTPVFDQIQAIRHGEAGPGFVRV